MQIIVLGMHRSGTSATARLINLMGASAGHPDVIARPAADNAKGFWERSDVRDLNDRLLASRGASWDEPLGQSGRVEAAPKDTTQLESIVFELDADRPWVLKDPRLCLTFPVWRPRLEAPVCVFVLRHPEEVAFSLRTRDGLPTALSLALWEHYVASAIESAGGLPCLWVDYAQLVSAPESGATQMHADLQAAGCTGLRLPSRRELEAFLSPELRHHVATDDHRTHPAVKLYRALIDGDRDARAGRWTVSAGSSELLAWHSLRRAERRGFEERIAVLEEASSATVATAMQESDALAEAQRARLQKSEQSRIRATNRLREAELNSTELRRVIADQRLSSLCAVRQAEARVFEETEARRVAERRLASETHGRAEAQRQADEWRSAYEGLLLRLDRLGEEFTHAGLDGANQRRRANLQRLRDMLHEQQASDLLQLSRWLNDALDLMRASFGSARWHVGNRVIRIVEMLLLRKRPRLAQDHILQIERNFCAWKLARVDQRALLRHLQQESLPSVPDAVNPSQYAASNVGPSQPPPSVEPKRDTQVRDVLCFPVIDWHFRMQRPQHLARVLGQRGHRVFYLSTQPAVGCARNGFELIESPASNVWLVRLCVTCKAVPNLYKDRLGGSALAAYVDALDAFRTALGISTPVAIVDLPYWRPLVEAVPGAVMIYDCMDHHAGFSTNSPVMLGEEEVLLRSADAVIVTSGWLQESLGSVRPVELIRNGADIERYACPPELPLHLSEKPVVGYVGAISDWFDVALIEQAAKQMPEVDFVLVGDITHPNVSPLAGLANVRLVGEVPYEVAAAHVHAFDVCTIPFVISDLTLATNPVKAYEYLAAGKPVVATAMPELYAMDGLIRVADDARQFIAHLREALVETPEGGASERRRQWARKHDWRERGEALHALMARQLPKASVVVLAWNNLQFTRDCLQSLERFTDYPDWELILVDNASTDGTREFFLEYAATRAHVRVVSNSTNVGFAAGNNAGIRAASGEIIVLLNNDTYVTPGWLSGLVGHLSRNPDLGIVGPVTNNIGNEARIRVDYGDMEQMLVESRRWTRRHPRQLTHVDSVAFFCCALSRIVIEEVGLIDENFGQGFFEDDDYCNRIRASGRKVAIADDIFVHHHLSASFSMLNEGRRRELFEGNKLIYEAKWGKWKPHRYRLGQQ